MLILIIASKSTYAKLFFIIILAIFANTEIIGQIPEGSLLSDIFSNTPFNSFTSFVERDNTFTLSVGGNLTIPETASKIEGCTFIYGNFDMQKSSGAFNLGVAVVGSYIVLDDYHYISLILPSDI